MRQTAPRQCINCGRIAKSPQGLARHYNRCSRSADANTHKNRASKLLLKPFLDNDGDSAASSRGLVYSEPNDVLTARHDIHPLSPYNEAPFAALNDDAPFATPDDDPAVVIQYAFDESDQLNQVHVEEALAKSAATASSSAGKSSRPSGMLSSDTTVEDETFESVTNRAAGTAYSRPRRAVVPEEAEVDAEIFFPFKNETDFKFARWCLQYGLSNSAIDSFLKNPSFTLTGQYGPLGIRNAIEMRSLMEDMGKKELAFDWKRSTFSLPSSSDMRSAEYEFYYLDVTNVIRLLMKHEPLKGRFHYAPVRRKTEDGHRIYDSMHTSDWWWDVQKELPTGATIVPLLISSDKTQLSQHNANHLIWPVYISIGNLDSRARRSQTAIGGNVLVALIPIAKKVDFETRMEIYHTAMGILLEPIKTHSIEGVEIKCADGAFRICYPVIAAFIADYEEQVLVTGVKSGRHCTMCQVPPDAREQLTIEWPARSASYTKDLLQRQALGRAEAREAVHSIRHFTTGHRYVNIYEAIAPDILHQLLKGVFEHVVSWTEELLSQRWPEVVKRKRKNCSDSASAPLKCTDQLDLRFNSVPHFQGIRRFKEYSRISQWTGDMYRSLSRVYLAVVTPMLLQIKELNAIRCIRAILDFLMLVEYRTQNEETLSYIDQAIDRFDAFVDVFRVLQRSDGFNFPKFHSITHFVRLIRRFGPAPDLDTNVSERSHIDKVKKPYRQSNKQHNFEDQIVVRNIQDLAMTVADERLAFRSTREVTNGELELRSDQIPRPAGFLQFPLQGRHGTRSTQDLLERYSLKPGTWTLVRNIQPASADSDLNAGGFMDIIAVFVRERRAAVKGQARQDESVENLEPDPTWAADLPVRFYRSVVCWKDSAEDPLNINHVERDAIHCSEDWHGQGVARYDFLWVQEEEIEDPSGVALENNRQAPQWVAGKRIGQLRQVFSVFDPMNYDQNGRHLQHYGAIVELFQFEDGGRVDDTHGMMTIKPWNGGAELRRGRLGSRRGYTLSTLVRSAHVIPMEGSSDRLFVNNYADWDQFNSLYDPDFVNKGKEAAKKARKQYGRRARGAIT